jgi:hypothetical protein
MFIDVVNAGWVPIYNVNLSEDVIGYMGDTLVPDPDKTIAEGAVPPRSR